MRRMQQQYEISFVFASHDRAVIREADDTIFLKDGVIRGIRRRGDTHPEPPPDSVPGR